MPKCSGAVRICINLKLLKESVLHEIHTILTLDDTLAQLSGASVFTELDASCGFWQPKSLDFLRLLLHQYCFNKLPFGISDAPELFQRRINQVM